MLWRSLFFLKRKYWRKRLNNKKHYQSSKTMFMLSVSIIFSNINPSFSSLISLMQAVVRAESWNERNWDFLLLKDWTLTWHVLLQEKPVLTRFIMHCFSSLRVSTYIISYGNYEISRFFSQKRFVPHFIYHKLMTIGK